MSSLRKGLLLGLVQVAIVASLGAKLTWDRAHLPRVWTKVAVYDPDLPIRGRYLALQLEVKIRDADAKKLPPPPAQSEQSQRWGPWQYSRANVKVEDGELIAEPTDPPQGHAVIRRYTQAGLVSSLQEPVLFFLPEHAADPWQQAKSGSLWAEVTVPQKGPPRPIRLAVKHGEVFTPLDIR